MKVRVTFKTPDAVQDSVDREVERAVDHVYRDGAESKQEAADDLRFQAVRAISKWVKYGECVTVEFDTEAGTATVIPA